MNRTSLYNRSQYQDGDSIKSVALITLSCIFLFVGVFGNLAVIIYNIYLNHGRTISSWLITNLAVANLLVCLTLYSRKIARNFLYEEKYEDVFTYLFYVFRSMFHWRTIVDRKGQQPFQKNFFISIS